MNDTPRTVDERYQSAANTSDLRVRADRRGDADVLIAAGMSGGSFGGLLLRLVSEWDGTSRLVQPQDRAEFALRLGRAKSLPAAREQLRVMVQANALAVDADAVLLWFLDHVCGACEGRRWQRIKDTPALSGKPCPACRGSGERALPGGEGGRRLEAYIANCLSDARGSIRGRLRNDSGRV